jgi:hypothetical protein
MNTEIEIIKDAINFLERHKSKLGTSDSSDTYRIDVILSILSNIESSEEEWLEKCKYLYPKYRIEFLTDLNSLQASTPEIIPNLIEEIYCRCAYFLREYILYEESMDSYKYRFGTNNLIKTQEKILNDNYYFIDKQNEKRLEMIKNRQLDIWILGYYFYSKPFKSFEKYEDLVKESNENALKIEKKIQEKEDSISKFIEKKQKEVDILDEKLNNLKTAFNFVGLSQGFENLLSQKNNSKWISFSIMTIFCILLITVPIVFIGGRFLNWLSEYNINWNDIGWEHTLPIFGLEFVLIYFFRVVLTHYNSIQTQIMQIELRQSLCQFIQYYADYAKEIKEKDGASLEKFENLIFSSILSTPDKVPSTFDGLEQLSNLIKNLKSGN